MTGPPWEALTLEQKKARFAECEAEYDALSAEQREYAQGHAMALGVMALDIEKIEKGLKTDAS